MNEDDSKPEGEPPPKPPKWVGTLSIYEAAANAEVREAEEKKPEDQNCPLNAYERRSLNTQRLIVLVTAAYAFFAGLQWHATREGFRVAQRARVAFTNEIPMHPVPLQANQEIWIRANYANTGAIAATNVVTKVGWVIDREFPAKPTYQPLGQIESRAIIPPHSDGGHSLGKIPPISDVQFAAIYGDPPQLYLFIHGLVTYDDGFDGHRFSQLCVFYKPDQGFGPKWIFCDKYNDAN